MELHRRERLLVMGKRLLLVVLLLVITQFLVQRQALRGVPASTPLSGASSNESEDVMQLAEPINMTVEWYSVDAAWGREGDTAHYIATKTEPVIPVRTLRDVYSLDFADIGSNHRLSAVAGRAANLVGAPPLATSTSVFFVAENIYEGAFVHWVTESAVFLHYWAELLQRYPNLKLWVRNTKDYKRLTAAIYGIGPERIVTGQLPLPNLCLFPPLQKENTDRLDFPLFITLVDKHFERLRAAAEPFKLEGIPILIMPRQSKENYASNDREIPGYDVLGEWATRIGGVVLNTDDVTSMGEQASVVLASKVIVCDYGSSLFFNGLTAQNSIIFVVGNQHHHECLLGQNCALGHAYLFLKIISNGNQLHFIHPGDVQAIRDIVPTLPP